MMKNLTIENIIAACRGEFFGDMSLLRREVSAVITDSRAIIPGALFAAMRGERADGHDFIPSAFAGGAVVALCERIPEAGVLSGRAGKAPGGAPPAGAFIKVPSSEEALGDIAAFYRAQFAIPLIGVTGSVGKTTTKEMLASVLSAKYNTLKTEGNFNNQLGVPLTLFRLRPEHELAVVEMGISHFGEMARLSEIARPDMAVFTVIGSAHLEFLGNREGVLRAKTEMLQTMDAGSPVFVNGDDDLLASLEMRQRRIAFGLGAHNDVRAEKIALGGETGIDCDIVGKGRRIRAHIDAYGEHMVYAALAAAAAAFELGLTDRELLRGIAEYETVGRRARIIRTGRLTIVDDCYNANPTSMVAALRSLMSLPGRHVCILGDMLELGEDAGALHYETGKKAAELGADLVVGGGLLAERICEGAATAGAETVYFGGKAAIIEALPELLRSGDAVLIKASRSMKFEDITAAAERL